ncbi:MAG: class SAM-dependent methyltransferase [Solirubrobacterales bacterium]|nr:class SAM-dependent methyltransferase [Solirubrobacterales bacterium]
MGPVLGRDPLIPPKRLLRYGRADFAERGDGYLGHLLDLGLIQRGHRVLDVGCGPGTLARPLVRYLDDGAYEGFDIDRAAIGWCRRAYRRRHPRARFVRADVFHPRIHPGGAHTAAEYRFPYDDASFDLVLAASVFPHMLEAETARYLEEARRVLRPGAALLATFFVLDDGSRAAIAAGEATFDFLDPEQHVAVVSEDLPDEAVAYDRGWIGERLGLEPEVHEGRWRGGEGLELVDIVVVRA